MNYADFKKQVSKNTINILIDGINIYHTLKDYHLTCDAYEHYLGIREKNRILLLNDKKILSLFLSLLRSDTPMSKMLTNNDLNYSGVLEYLNLSLDEVVSLSEEEIEFSFNYDFNYIIDQIRRNGLIKDNLSVDHLNSNTFGQQLCSSYSTDSRIVNDIYTGISLLTADKDTFTHKSYSKRPSKVTSLGSYRATKNRNL
ncbi:MAG: hypothetical protein PHQ89_01185 [Bacilli bacterium]|nr:hypothetical protein [Bacilli bacterium]